MPENLRPVEEIIPMHEVQVGEMFLLDINTLSDSFEKREVFLRSKETGFLESGFHVYFNINIRTGEQRNLDYNDRVYSYKPTNAEKMMAIPYLA